MWSGLINQVWCVDVCQVIRDNDHHSLMIGNNNVWDSDHQSNNMDHYCFAKCVDTSHAVDIVMTKFVPFKSGAVPLTLANETMCIIRTIKYTGSDSNAVSTAGGCKLGQQLFNGLEGTL